MVGNTVRARGHAQAWEFDSSTFRKQGEGMNAVSNGDKCPSKREVEVISEWRDGAYWVKMTKGLKLFLDAAGIHIVRIVGSANTSSVTSYRFAHCETSSS